jgi:parvulin-like peptidyl-prolyl isomerase
MHYYSTQQHIDFSSKSGKEQLADFKRRALDQVIDDAYVKQIAKKNNISVSRGEINDQINLLKNQDRLGGNNQVFKDVLREFWDWSPDDFRRELRQQILAQKVVSKLDTKAHQKADDTLAQLQSGTDFATLAKSVSEDEATKPGGGEYGFPIERGNRDIQPQVLNELFKLQPKETSGIIETPLGLEIVKVYENTDGKLRAAHIVFGFETPDRYLEPLKKDNPPSRYVSL